MTLEDLAKDPTFDPDAAARDRTDGKRPGRRPATPPTCNVGTCFVRWPWKDGTCGYCRAKVRQMREAKAVAFLAARAVRA